MKETISTILVPVELNEKYFAVAKQAAELAARHHAALHLIHIERNRWTPGRLFNTKKYRNQLYLQSNEVIRQLDEWQLLLAKEHGITVSIDIGQGDPLKSLLRYAVSVKADLIMTLQDGVNALPGLCKEFEGQVILLRNQNQTIAEWHQVVIPVTDFVPETRIRTIIDIARQFHLKIHLVSAINESVTRKLPEFYYLTETVKRFKTTGNISIECHCLPLKANRINAYLAYCQSIGADVLMINHPPGKKRAGRLHALYAAGQHPIVQFSYAKMK